MKLAFVVLGLLLLLPFSFADIAPPDCDTQKDICTWDCCTDSGGTFTETNETVACSGGSGTFDTCAYAVCRPNLAECKAPRSGCGQSYKSCFTGCRDNGGNNTYCDNLCWNQADECISNALDNPGGYCGPAAGLLGIAGAALAFRRKS